MKKNLISVLILLLTAANLVLTIVLMFTILPETKKANELITSVASAIDLELSSGDVVYNANRVSEEDKDYKDLSDSLTITLRDNGDGKLHYVVLKVTIALDKNSEAYAVYGTSFGSYESVIKSIVNNVVSAYTIEEMRADAQDAADEILIQLQSTFASDLVVGVAFPSATYQ